MLGSGRAVRPFEGSRRSEAHMTNSSRLVSTAARYLCLIDTELDELILNGEQLICSAIHIDALHPFGEE